MCVCECMCVVRTYVLRYTRTRQQSQLAMSALSVCFVTCCTRYIVPFNCRQQPPTQLPPNVIPPRSSVALSLSLSLPLVFLWTVYNVQCWFCYSLWIELQSVLVSLQSVRTALYPVKHFVIVVIHFPHLQRIFLSHTPLNFLPSQLEIQKYHITLHFVAFPPFPPARPILCTVQWNLVWPICIHVSFMLSSCPSICAIKGK